MTVELLAAVLLAALVLWMVVGPLTSRGDRPGPDPDEIVPVEETRRGQALLALKEIDFDRATGKLSEGDYARLREKYVAEALDVLRHDEAGPGAEAPASADPAEALVAHRARVLSGASDGTGVVCPRCGPRPEADALFCSSCGDPIGAPGVCGSCGTRMPPASRFCPSCGQRAELTTAT